MVLYGYSGGTQALDIDTRARGNGEHLNEYKHPREFESVYGPYKILTNQCFLFIFTSYRKSLFVMWQKQIMSSTSSQVMFLKWYQLQNFMEAEANN